MSTIVAKEGIGEQSYCQLNPRRGIMASLTVVQRLVNLKDRDTPSLPDGGHPVRGSNYIIKGIRQERLANFGNKGALIRIYRRRALIC